MTDDILLTAPIPGQSLTVEPGSVPWEQPPQYVTIDDVASFYSDKLDNPEAIFELMSLLENGTPVLTIVNTMVKSSIMKGYHTVDTGFLVTPIIVEIIKTLADLNDVTYTVTAEDAGKENTVSPAIIKQLIDEAKKKVKKSPEAIVERKGLMAKGVA
jgi:hypothetical protein